MHVQEYNQFQVKQLTKLIEVTRTDLKKEDRQKVMNMITIDAHSRDMVESIVESGADRYTLPLVGVVALAKSGVGCIGRSMNECTASCPE